MSFFRFLYAVAPFVRISLRLLTLVIVPLSAFTAIRFLNDYWKLGGVSGLAYAAKVVGSSAVVGVASVGAGRMAARSIRRFR